jgi:hypothetical protein
MWQSDAPLCQGCGYELGYDEIGTKCDLCIAEVTGESRCIRLASH